MQIYDAIAYLPVPVYHDLAMIIFCDTRFVAKQFVQGVLIRIATIYRHTITTACLEITPRKIRAPHSSRSVTAVYCSSVRIVAGIRKPFVQHLLINIVI
ncbi:hypothetical protein SDC9_94907 [bioreactor metagenome]|uniref:Uncharacterized protein n=1 Tax=bioreactor metagenome TaxID=1076179 RepID=A0A645ABH4_9ZZZZ